MKKTKSVIANIMNETTQGSLETTFFGIW